MRQREYLNPDEMRELDALDRVLAGDRVDADLREFEDLVLDVRASAPEMTPAFAARLEHEASEGFPTRAADSPKPRRRRFWVLVPAAGTLAAMAIAVVVVLGQNGDAELAATQNSRQLEPLGEPSVAEDSASSGSTDQFDEAPVIKRQSKPSPRSQAAARPPSAPQELSVPPPPPPATASGGRSAAGPPAPASSKAAAPAPPPATADRSANRKVVRDAQIVLETPKDKLDSTADAVVRTVDRFNGIVQSASSGSSDSSGGEAIFELRIPTDKLDDALAALSKLGHVAERSQNLQDITGSFTSAQDRLADARAERRGLLKALGRATTPLQLQSLRARLRTVRSTIARLNGDLESLRRRADLSSIQLSVRGTGKSQEGAGGGGEWTPGDAAGDAVRVLEVIAGVTLIALAIAVPFVLLGVAIMLGVRVGRRRRREGALDAA